MFGYSVSKSSMAFLYTAVWFLFVSFFAQNVISMGFDSSSVSGISNFAV